MPDVGLRRQARRCVDRCNLRQSLRKVADLTFVTQIVFFRVEVGQSMFATHRVHDLGAGLPTIARQDSAATADVSDFTGGDRRILRGHCHRLGRSRCTRRAAQIPAPPRVSDSRVEAPEHCQ